MTDVGPVSAAAGDAAAKAAAASAANAALASQLEERLIHQEYKIWKKNTPFLYDFVMTHGLEWPSLTCEWLPVRKELRGGRRSPAGGGGAAGGSEAVAEQHEMLLGTHTTGEQNYLMVATVNLPKEDAVLDQRTAAAAGEDGAEDGQNAAAAAAAGSNGATKKRKAGDLGSTGGGAAPSPKSIVLDAPHPASNYNEEKDELGGYASADRVGTIDVKMKIPHDGEVNRARHMPQNHFVVATRGPASEVYVWDLSQHASFPAVAIDAAAAPTTGRSGSGTSPTPSAPAAAGRLSPPRPRSRATRPRWRTWTGTAATSTWWGAAATTAASASGTCGRGSGTRPSTSWRGRTGATSTAWSSTP